MPLLLRLPFIVAETVVREGLSAASALLRLVRDPDGDEVFVAPAAPPRYAADRSRRPEPQPAAPEPPRPTAQDAIARRREREAAATPPPASARAAAPEPARPEPDHVDREAVVVESLGPADSPGPAMEIQEPWDGYDGMPAGAVVQRLRGADEATKAVVLLYEQRHKARRTVLAATTG